MTPFMPSGIGINFVSAHGDFLYYDSSQRRQISRIPTDLRTGTATGDAQILLQSNETMDPQGSTFRKTNLRLANAIFNEINLLPSATKVERISLQSVKVVAGDPRDTIFVGPTDRKFGKKALDVKRGSLYVTTTELSGHNWTYGDSSGDWTLVRTCRRGVGLDSEGCLYGSGVVQYKSSGVLSNN
jgi:hypothetical protein